MKSWIQHGWLQPFLPDHLKPVDDHIFTDRHGTRLIEDVEHALEQAVEHASTKPTGRQYYTFKRNRQTMRFKLKVNKKRMKLTAYETQHAEAAVTKRIVIDYTRKYYEPKNQSKRLKEASIHYIKNGRTYARSIQHSERFTTVFLLIEQLDEMLLGTLSPETRKAGTPTQTPAAETEQPLKRSHELDEKLYACERIVKTYNERIPAPVSERLRRFLKAASDLSPLYEQLDVEERYNLRRMLDKDIPELLSTFNELTEQTQQEETENLYAALVQMELTVQRMQERMKTDYAERWEQLMKLNELRYRKP
ncbi:hypothetical protein B0H94_103176 [Salsuginibacillus halophilus]|uniref:Uncharacterized protein n=1 Tax=Salsuginibacillus halophilus TaxID=517424 RepID=A0A2P8HWK5_9BACI|nr:hypothetical protein [Salsuginibacillus halophilus]PSL50564.1 hypothetical protein B0H94_103176 [Salsuginibacillus halophilus]